MAKTCFYVAVDGNDGNQGTREAPFASIERARDEIEARVARSWPDAAGIRDVAEFVGADEIASRRAEFSSEAWRWGRTPEFRTGFDVCGHRFRFRVVAGAVAECMAGPDEAVCAALVGARFSSGAFADVFAAQGWTPGAEAAARMRF